MPDQISPPWQVWMPGTGCSRTCRAKIQESVQQVRVKNQCCLDYTDCWHLPQSHARARKDGVGPFPSRLAVLQRRSNQGNATESERWQTLKAMNDDQTEEGPERAYFLHAAGARGRGLDSHISTHLLQHTYIQRQYRTCLESLVL